MEKFVRKKETEDKRKKVAAQQPVMQKEITNGAIAN